MDDGTPPMEPQTPITDLSALDVTAGLPPATAPDSPMDAVASASVPKGKKLTFAAVQAHEETHLLRGAAGAGGRSGGMPRMRPNWSHSSLHTLDSHVSNASFMSNLNEAKSSFIDRHIYPGSMASAILNFVIASVGAGVFTMPFAFQGAGIILTLAIMAVCGAFTILSLRYLSIAIQVTDLHTFEDLAFELGGRAARWWVQFVLIIGCYGMCIGYIIVVADVLDPLRFFPGVPEIFRGHEGRTYVTCLFWLVIMLPLSLLKKISALRFSSIIAIASILFITFVVCFRFAYPLPHSNEQPWNTKKDHRHHMQHINWFSFHGSALLAIPLIMFTFECQSMVFKIQGEMRDGSVKNVTYVAMIVVSFCAAIMVVVGICGYLTFIGHVEGNILANYDPKADPLVALSYVGCAVSVTLAFAMYLFPSRDAIFGLWYDMGEGPSDSVYTYMSVFLSAAALYFAVNLPQVEVVMSLCGGLCSSTICFTYPAMYILCLHRAGEYRLKTRTDKALCISMLLLGLGGGALGTWVSVAHMMGYA